MPFIGFILIAMGLFAVGGTLYMVVREPQEHDDWYIPPAPVVAPPTTSAVSTPVPTPPPATANPDMVSADQPDKPADQPADKTE